MKRIIGFLLTATLMFALCGTAFAAEMPEQEEEPVKVEIMTGPGPAVIEMDADSLDWTIEQLDTLSDIVSNVGDRSYDMGAASKYDIHMGVEYDKDLVNAVLFDTNIIDFGTPGDYETIYWIFFNREPLLDYLSENGMDAENYPGLEEADTEHVVFRVDATTTINGAGTEAAEDDGAEYKTAAYKGLTFSYPADGEYEYDEINDMVSITLGNNETMILFMSASLGGSENGYDEETVDFILEYTILSAVSAYDDYQDESEGDLIFAGCTAKEVTALVSVSSTWMSYNCIAFFDQDAQYLYEIQYATKNFDDGNLTEYMDILNSVTLGSEGSIEDESDDSIAASEDSNASGGNGTEGRTFDEDQLEIKAVPTEDGLVAVFITNNSDDIIQELEVQINYKDESGATIDLDTDGHDVILPGSTVVSRMSAPSSYSDYEVETDIDLDAHPYYKNHAEDVEIQSNLGEDCIIIEITNNSDVSIREIEYDVVLYKDGDIVTIMYPQDVYDVEPGKTVTEKESTSRYEFDDYEIYLNQAHTFDRD